MEPGAWRCLYTRHKTQKRKVWQEGLLRTSRSALRVELLAFDEAAARAGPLVEERSGGGAPAPGAELEWDGHRVNEHSIHLLLYAYAQSINKLKKEAAGRVLDYWFAWTGVEFFKKLINAYKAIVVHIITLKEVAADADLIQRHNFLKSSMPSAVPSLRGLIANAPRPGSTS